MSGRETVRQAFDALNRHDTRALASLYADNAVVHDPQYPEPLRGREAVQRDMDDFVRSFPDLQAEIQTTMEEPGKLSYEAELTGTHNGPLTAPTGEIPPTGKRVGVKAAIFCDFNENGQIIEEHRYYDIAGLLGQLGVQDSLDVNPQLPRA